jgi:hypothetical protein
MTLLAAFIASFCFIALKALQQRQVVHDQYLLIVPTSVLMAVCEVYVIHNIAVKGWGVPLVLAVGLGSGLGCLSAMLLHRRYLLNGKRVQTHE